MGFVLRDYQEEAVQACVDILQSPKRTCKELVVVGTGGGKSLCVAEAVRRIDEPVIILQPSKEILLQNHSKFIHVGGEATICCASLKTKTIDGEDYTQNIDGELLKCREISKVTFATVGTLKTYKNELKALGVKKALVDEAHIGSKSGSQMRELFKSIGINHVVGLTATPLYLDGGMEGARLKMMNRVRGKLFSDIRYVSQISHLVENNYWSKLNYKVLDTDESYLKENSNGSDFTVESMRNHYKANNLKEQIKEEANNLLKQGRKSILIFLPTIAEAEELQTIMPNSKVVHSKTPPEERDTIIRDFKNHKISIVLNINILSIGFDHPTLDAVITARATTSIAYYYQQIGRAVRIHPSKKDAIIVDFSGNVKRFGRLEGLHFENVPFYGWGLFNERNEVLTDIPIKAKTRPTKESLIEHHKPKEPTTEQRYNPEFTFGMFKGRKLWDIAQSNDSKRLQSYASWIWDQHVKGEFKFFGESGNQLKQELRRYLKLPDTNTPQQKPRMEIPF